MKLNLTQAQNMLVQGLWSVIAGVIITTITAGYQAWMTGHVDITTIATFLLSTFLVGLSKALEAYIPQHIPQELQAVQDTQQEILSIVNGFTVPRAAIPKQPTGPTAVVPAFTPPARPATVQATQADVPQQPFPAPTQPPAPMPDMGG